MKVLVADDDTTSRVMLNGILRKWGFIPCLAEDGEQAWQIMQQPEAPPLALLDWEMPGLNGTELCRRICAAQQADPPYLIMLTVRADKADMLAGFDAGANDYVVKPFDTDELHARLRVGRRMMELQADLIEAKRALAHEAMHDALTGALNRNAILKGLDKELQRAQRRGSKLSIGLLDIDFFKRVNDTYGHPIGDQVLCRFVTTLQNSLRGYDLVGRYGGEEFLVVAPDSAGTREEGLYERLKTQIAELALGDLVDGLSITASIGVAVVDPQATLLNLVANADAALYQAKYEGRNRVVYASSTQLCAFPQPPGTSGAAL